VEEEGDFVAAFCALGSAERAIVPMFEDALIGGTVYYSAASKTHHSLVLHRAYNTTGYSNMYSPYKTHAQNHTPSHHSQAVLQQHISKREKMDRGLKFWELSAFVLSSSWQRVYGEEGSWSCAAVSCAIILHIWARVKSTCHSYSEVRFSNHSLPFHPHKERGENRDGRVFGVFLVCQGVRVHFVNVLLTHRPHGWMLFSRPLRVHDPTPQEPCALGETHRLRWSTGIIAGSRVVLPLDLAAQPYLRSLGLWHCCLIRLCQRSPCFQPHHQQGRRTSSIGVCITTCNLFFFFFVIMPHSHQLTLPCVV